MGRDTTPKPTPSVDTSRLLFALLLGASATTLLLASASFLASRGPDGRASPGRWAVAVATLLVLGGWLAGVALLAQERRGFGPAVLVGIPGAVALLGVLGPVRRVVAGVPWGVRLGMGSLRALGLVRLGAWAAGWLPAGFALGAAGIDLGLGAVALLWSLRAARPGRGWLGAYALVSVLSAAATGVWAQAALRPMPGWELLAGGFLGPLWALVALGALPGASEAKPG